MQNAAPQPLPSDLADPLAHARARVHPFASRVLWFPETTSTNDVAAAAADADAPEGLLVAADCQTAGRGRQGRAWASPPGAGIYATVVLRPSPAAVPLITIAAGVAVAEGVEAATGLRTLLKWPNDLLAPEREAAADGRKVAGILAEAGSSAAGQWVALGFGINVLPGAYPSDVAARATSLSTELGRVVDRGTLLVECLAALARRYSDLSSGRRAAVLDAWRQRAAETLGRRVEWDAGGVVREGIARDIDATGALLVQDGGGWQRVIAGEVRWR